jgi:putative protease
MREIEASISLRFEKDGDNWTAIALCQSEDGRKIERKFDAGSQEATNHERMLGMLGVQLGKTAGIYRFTVKDIDCSAGLPFMSASTINGIRRALADELDGMPCIKRDLLLRQVEKDISGILAGQKEISYKFNVSNHLSEGVYTDAGALRIAPAYELSHTPGAELMRTKYCIRYELGMSPVHHKAADPGPLFLLNNGQRFALHFDCRNCEMVLTEASNTPSLQK